MSPCWANEIGRVSDPAVSPDGKMLAFSWQGDIWVSSIEGGKSTRLTVHPAEDTMPKWTKDGRHIIFSSTRSGNADVYMMTTDGNELKRLTFESSTEYPQAVSPDGQYVFGYTNAFGRLDLFKVSIRGGDLIRLTEHPLEMEYYPSISPDGKYVLYNTSGGAGNWRKPGHSGSNTSRVWIAENSVPLKNHHMVLQGDHNDMFPVYVSDTKFALISNRSGAPNVFSCDVSGSGLKQLTKFTSGTLRALSASQDGSIMAFQKDSKIWTLDSNGNLKELQLLAPADMTRDPIQEITLTSGISSFTVSPNGKRAVIAARGDIFFLPERGGTTRRLTESPKNDSQPVWLDDQKVLYVAAGEAGKREFRTESIDGQSHKLFKSDPLDLNSPVLSPDKKWLAFHRGNHQLCVMPVSGGEPTVLAEGDFGESLGGSRSFNWSPDSQWIVYRVGLFRGIQIAMIQPNGGRKIELTRVGKSASTPVFSTDGKSVVFSAIEGTNFSEVRDSKSPLMVIDLVPQPITYSEDDLDKIDSPKEEPSKDITVKIVEKGLRNRIRQLGTGSSNGIWPAVDGRSVFANVEGQFSTVSLKSGVATPVAGVTGSVSDVEIAGNKQKVYFVQAGKPNALNMAGGAVAPISFAATYKVDQTQEEIALFEEIWWAMSQMYYNPEMNGKNWNGIRESFAKMVPWCTSREDFYALMGEMMELLDSSHLGATAPAGSRNLSPDDTGWLGVTWNWGALDSRHVYIVDHVYDGTPASHPDSELASGDQVMTVDGQELKEGVTLASLLNKKAGKKVRLQVLRNLKTVEVTIQPARASTRTGVMYYDWVQNNKKMVDQLSKGRLGYIHIQAMDVSSLDTFLKEIQTDLNGKDGVLLDVRYNGGGFTSHIILNTMLKTPWLIRTNRDQPEFRFSENNYRGNALELPAACLTNQYSFSNAEIFSEGFRALKLGPIIGERTAGGVIGTGAYGLWDGGQIRMPGSGAFSVKGENLEQNGRMPDINIAWDPNVALQGRDPQIEAAVKALLEKLSKNRGKN